MASISELKQQSMKLETEISDLLDIWREENKDILDRKMEIDLAIMEAEKESV